MATLGRFFIIFHFVIFVSSAKFGKIAKFGQNLPKVVKVWAGFWAGFWTGIGHVFQVYNLKELQYIFVRRRSTIFRYESYVHRVFYQISSLIFCFHLTQCQKTNLLARHV